MASEFKLVFTGDVKSIVQELIRHKNDGKDGKKEIIKQQVKDFKQLLGVEIDKIVEIVELGEFLK